MRNKTTLVIALAMAAVLCASVCLAKEGGAKKAPKDAVLLVAFGTTVPEAQKALDAIDARVKKEFPDTRVQWAYTSKIVRKKLAEQGKILDPPAVALSKLIEDGHKNILVASLHSLPGVEFHELVRDVEALRMIARASHGKIFLSAPLLSSRENMTAVAKAAIKELPASRTPDDAVLLMGHGSEHHPGDAAYAALNYWMEGIDPRVFVGTVEGQPRIEDMLPKLSKIKPKKVFLMPLMAVAGDHARNDLCGDEKDSWKSILEKAGYKVECVLKGTGEMPGVMDVWMANIKRTYENMKKHD
jgi:sirohydrochlorin cobaltochelatase